MIITILRRKLLNIIFLFANTIYFLKCELYYRIVKNRNNTFFLINDRYKYFRIVPDIETVGELGFDHANLLSIESISDHDKMYNIDSISYKFIANSIPSLKYNNPNNGYSRLPDDRMRNCIQKILAIEPADFWLGSYILSEDRNIVNPSMVKWKNYGIISTYRNDLWNKEKTRIGWITQKHKKVDKKTFGSIDVDNSTDLNDPSTSGPQYDCRLIIVNNSLIVTYATEYQQHGQYVMVYLKLEMNENTKTTSVSESGHLLNKMKSGSLVTDYGMASQKNWIPFVYKNESIEKLFYIQNINPLHVVEYDPIERSLSTISKLERVPIPWPGEYGLPIRGGTPAILVNGVYLSIFHTVSMFQMPYKLKTYFIGAITFCPNPPFNIHSISKYPIVKESFYSGEWVKNNLDYVLFPVGIIKDKLDKYLFISMGVQDKNGFVVKFEIEGLFKSLNIISNCTLNS